MKQFIAKFTMLLIILMITFGFINFMNITNVAYGSTELITNDRFTANVAGEVIPRQYIFTVNNDSQPMVNPSPSGLQLFENQSALLSSIMYLENRSIDVFNTYNFNKGGVAIALELPLSRPGATHIGERFTVADAKIIFPTAAPVSAADNVPLTNVSQFCEIALQGSNIQTCEPNMKGYVSSTQSVPNGLLRIGGHTSEIENFQSSNIVIAVMDTGIDPHPDLNLNQILSKTFIGDNQDNWNHGTHVAGIIAAKDNSFGVVGVAPGAELWSIKVLDNKAPNRPGGTDSFLAGITYIADLARTLNKKIIVNLSITLGSQSPSLNLAVSEAVKRGVTFVAAAGNLGIDAALIWPGSIEDKDAIVVSAIGDSDGICGSLGSIMDIIVDPTGPTGQLNPDDSFARTFSNDGPSVDVAAAGVNINSTSNNGSYHIDSGTSMAAPYVTGAAALYIAKNPDKTPYEVEREIIRSSIPSTITQCNGGAVGYFTGDSDGIPEGLLHAKTFLP